MSKFTGHVEWKSGALLDYGLFQASDMSDALTKLENLHYVLRPDDQVIHVNVSEVPT